MSTEIPSSIRFENNSLVILDQTKLPQEIIYQTITKPEEMFTAIQTLAIRGAGALSIGAAYGVYIGIKDKKYKSNDDLIKDVNQLADYLASSRPTAVKLFKLLNRIRSIAQIHSNESVEAIKKAILDECNLLREESITRCRKIGEVGFELMQAGDSILTHCNTGSYATIERGSALSPFYYALEQGLPFQVYADETRPLLQGSRLTAHELFHAGVDVTVICDNMAAYLMQQGKIDKVFVGCDRVALNGDTANKIGTYSAAVSAHYHKIPFYIACTLESVDIHIQTGQEIPIEERDPNEVRMISGVQTAPEGVKVYNPAFDVTPYGLITGFITDQGIIYPPFEANFKQLLGLNQSFHQ